MIPLEHYGWNNFFSEQYKKTKSDLACGRVISIKGLKYHLITSNGELETELSGKLLYGTSNEDLPKLGDWVLFIDYSNMGYVIEVLPRLNELARKNPGTKTERQVLAVNIDHALIVQGLDRDFNLMRMERYIVQLAACNINSIVILNKVDLIENPCMYQEEVMRLGHNCKIHLVSTYTDLGIEELKNNILEKHKTYILIGSSGVGKSSILNALMSQSLQKTGGTSHATDKGKHTTSSRDLFQLPNESLVIDTPGMREFGVTTEDGQDTRELFPVIMEFAVQCHFNDCTHTNESECAVLNALQSGSLDKRVYDSYIKLIKEQRRFEIKAEDKRRLNKQFGKMTREAKNYRKKYKY